MTMATAQSIVNDVWMGEGWYLTVEGYSTLGAEIEWFEDEDELTSWIGCMSSNPQALYLGNEDEPNEF